MHPYTSGDLLIPFVSVMIFVNYITKQLKSK